MLAALGFYVYISVAWNYSKITFLSSSDARYVLTNFVLYDCSGCLGSYQAQLLPLLVGQLFDTLSISPRVAHFVEFGVQGRDFGLSFRVQFEQVCLRSLRNCLPLGYQLLFPLLRGSHRPYRHLTHGVRNNVFL